MMTYSVINDKEKLILRQSLEQLLGLLGVAVITSGRKSAISLPGVFLMVATDISWESYSVYERKFDVVSIYTYKSHIRLLVE